MNNTSQTSPSTNQVDANQNPQNPPAPVPAPSPVQPQGQGPSGQNPPTAVPSGQQNQPPQTNPSASSGQPQQQPNQPSLHARIFDKILRGMTGGPVRIVGPNGDIQEVPQSRTTMGKSIVAAALAGLMTPSHYRETPYGPVRDYSADMAGAAQAGQAAFARPQQQAQEQSNLQQTRKLFTLQNNVKLVQQAAAMAHQQHAVLDDVVKTNTEKFANPLAEWDKQRPAGEDSIFVNKGMTSQEVLNSGHSLTDHNVYIDGKQMKPDQFGVLEPEPTYTVLRTTNKDGSPISLKLPQEVTDELGKFNKGYEQAYTATGGNVIVPINNYMDAIHTYHTLNSVESFMNRVQKDVNPDGSKINLAAAYKNDPAGMWNAIQQAENALAAGNGRPGENTEDAILSRVAATPGGSQLLNLVGTPQQVEDWKNGLIAARNEAANKNPGKAPVDPAKIQGLPALAASLGLSKPQTAVALAKIPKTVDEYDAVLKGMQSQANTNTQTNLADKRDSGDPDEIKRTASYVVDGVPGSLQQMTSMRGKEKSATNLAILDEAKRRGLNPVNFGPAALDAKATMLKDYSENKPGTTGQNLTAFDAFLSHAGEALDASTAWQRANSPLLNRPLNWLAENAKDDPTYQQFKDALVPVRSEYMSFLNANRAEHTADIATMQTVLDDKATPKTIVAALQQLSKSADARLAAIGNRYLGTMGTTYPNLVSANGRAALQRFGVASQSIPLSQNLPIGWQDGSPKKLTDPAIAKQFVQAAGGNNARAAEIAKNNGWSF